jgi:hypothetical protein
MEVWIYQDTPALSDEPIGRIDETGKVYDVSAGRELYIGRIDYEEGEVYSLKNELLGWVEGEEDIVSCLGNEEDEIGFVNQYGEIFSYDDDGEDIYLGRVCDMQDSVEGAAALLLLFNY